MHVDVADQAQMLLRCLATGAGLGLVYDVLRAIRRSLRLRWVAFILDLLFWIGVTVLLFVLALLGEAGEVRLYLSGLFLVGGGVYLLTLSRLVLPSLLWVMAGIGKIWAFLTAPLRSGLRYTKKVFTNQKKDFQNWLEWYRITMEQYHTEFLRKGAKYHENKALGRWHKNSDTRPAGGGSDRTAVHAQPTGRRTERTEHSPGAGAGTGGTKQRIGRRHRPQQ